MSVDSAGLQGDSDTFTPEISADGRVVVFSWESDGGEGTADIVAHDRVTGQTTRVSVSSSGVQGNESSVDPAVTADGRVVVFSSGANNLVPNDTNGMSDVFAHDRVTDRRRASA